MCPYHILECGAHDGVSSERDRGRRSNHYTTLPRMSMFIGRHEEAIEMLHEAYTLDPASYTAMRNAAKILRLTGCNEKAEQLYMR